jgi:hypothetical protein
VSNAADVIDEVHVGSNLVGGATSSSENEFQQVVDQAATTNQGVEFEGDFTQEVWSSAVAGTRSAPGSMEAVAVGVESALGLDDADAVDTVSHPVAPPVGSSMLHDRPQPMSRPAAQNTPTCDLVDRLPGSTIESHPPIDEGGSSVVTGSVIPSVSDQDRPRTRLQNNIRKPKTYTDGTVRYVCLTVSGEPKSVEEALNHERWRGTMDEEYQALLKNKTWHLVPSQHASNVIDCKWVYKIKRK